MTPPELPGNGPIVDVLHPVEVNAKKSVGNKRHLTRLGRFDRRFGKRLHTHEPLLANDRLDDRATSIAVADSVSVWFDTQHGALLFEPVDNSLAGRLDLHSL